MCNPPIELQVGNHVWLVYRFGAPRGGYPVGRCSFSVIYNIVTPESETAIPNPGVIVTPEPPPAGACIVRALPLVLVVKPVNSREVGVYETESRDT